MNDLLDRVADAKDRVAPGWTPEREHLVRARIDVRVAMRRRWRRGFAVTLALAAMVTAAWVVWSRGPAHAPQAVASRNVTAALLRLEDGSTVVAKSPDARVEPIEIGPAVAAMRLVAGSALFSVTPNPNRAFRVIARDVTVTVLGTVFSVGLEPGGVRVAVERGRVHVAWPAGERVLAVGEQALIADVRVGTSSGTNAPAGAHDNAEPTSEPEQTTQPGGAEPNNAAREGENGAQGPGSAAGADQTAAPEAPAAGAPPPSTTPHSMPAAAAHGAADGSWRTLAQDGEYAAAFDRMRSAQPGAVRDEPGDLLLAADVARLGGHPDKAIAPLERVVQKHALDSRAPLAAFTLGRTLLDQLGRPREAAAAFATARRLEPHGAMAQDALAREVESWSRAGEASLARERAEEYVSTYPHGRRLGAVKRLGGLE